MGPYRLGSRRCSKHSALKCALTKDLNGDKGVHNGGMNMRFKAVDRETPYLLAPSIQDWLPEQHLVRFIVEVISKLDLHELKMPYTGVGSEKEGINSVVTKSAFLVWLAQLQIAQDSRH
jgi:hypothetical protein